MVQRLLALGVIAPLAIGAGIGWWDADYRVLTPAFFLLGGSGFWFYRDRRRDVPILAMVVFAAIAVLTLGLVQMAAPTISSPITWWRCSSSPAPAMPPSG
jgi:peptidoglycan/LPS O-acetylase OafA/YrhL